jgi:hypothetical protein
VGCTTGSREVPGERKPVIRHDNDVVVVVRTSNLSGGVHCWFKRSMRGKETCDKT